MSVLRSGGLLAAALLLTAVLGAWPLPVDDPEAPAPGTFLVAAQGLADANFRQSVVLLIDHDADGSWGLIVNLPTPLRLADLLPEEKDLRGREDRLFAGGPVAPNRLLMLFRSLRPPRDSRPLFDDVHLGWRRETLRVLDGKPVFRLYAGYAGWGPGQLQREISRGDWHLMPAEADLVFCEDLESLWELLVRRAPLQVAGSEPRRVGAPCRAHQQKAPAPSGTGATILRRICRHPARTAGCGSSAPCRWPRSL